MYLSKLVVKILSHVSILFICFELVCLEDEEIDPVAFLADVNNRLARAYYKENLAQWNYFTNLNEGNLEEYVKVRDEAAKENKECWDKIKAFDFKELSDPYLKRQVELLSFRGVNGLPSEKLIQLTKIINKMEETFSTAAICDYHDKEKCDLKLEPDIIDIMEKSRDPEELKHIWVQWRRAVGVNLKDSYKKYVELMNAAAVETEMEDAGEMWLSVYETKHFKSQIHMVWKQVQPLYVQLHAYVRFRLRKVYGSIVPEDGPIPAHLLGNMWGQTWINLLNITMPFTDRKVHDITSMLVNQRYTPVRLLQLAEQFQLSLNFSALPESFWINSMLTKPHDKEVICHPALFDMMEIDDVRLLSCMKVNAYYYDVAHVMVTQAEYILQYQRQPYIYRRVPVEAFGNAIGQIVSLSISNQKHWHTTKLIQEYKPNPYEELNNLFMIGLDRIAFLPFAYLLDLWRWGVFSGKVLPRYYNCKWWEYVHEIQGLQPPVERSEADLDPVSKYHVVSSLPYIDHFVSFIIQFQIYKALCIQAGQYNAKNPKKHLHECDLYGSKVAGNTLKEVMQFGRAKSWQDALQALTGQRELDASALIEYFAPLTNWLIAQNKKHNVDVGWGRALHVCKSSIR